MPLRSRSRYSSSFPGSDESAAVRWTPRTSIGSVLGSAPRRRRQGREVGAGLLTLARTDETGAHAERGEREQECGNGGAAP